jgi:hypothetical protein
MKIRIVKTYVYQLYNQLKFKATILLTILVKSEINENQNEVIDLFVEA